MNTLKGNITNVTSFEGLTLLKIDVDNNLIKSIIIDDEKQKQFSAGTLVEVLFKETELIISKEKTNLISLQNQFNCQIISIKKGALLSEIELQFKTYHISSIITTDSVLKLELKIGDMVTALVKTNEIMVASC